MGPGVPCDASATGSPTAHPQRPPNGSDRGKRAYVLLAIINMRPTVTRSELKHLLDWNDETLNEALCDLEILVTEPTAADA